MNVLLVEDERALSHEVEVFLTSQGFNVDVAFNGKSASEKIYINNYDFILLDIGLPDYNGFDLLNSKRSVIFFHVSSFHSYGIVGSLWASALS